jgi:4-hydroxybenzoate polyprenyltransferase
MKSLTTYLKLARLENTILPAFALAAGFTIARASSYKRFVLTLLVLVLAHTVVTIWNDIADEVGDLHNGITRIGDVRKSGVYNVLCLLIGISVGIIILVLVFLPTTTKILAFISLLLGWMYNERPIQASHRPVPSIVLLSLAYGAVPFLLGASLGHIGWPVIFLATGWTIGRGSLSLLKDYKDAKGDAAAEKRTFLLVHGGTLTAKLSFGLALLGFLLCVIAVGTRVHHTLTAAIVLGGVAMWLLYLRIQLFYAKQYKALDQIFHECLRYQLVFDGLVIVCLRTL